MRIYLPNSSQSSRKGFTVVELVVVIFIMGILASLVYFGISSWRQRAAETELKSDLTAVQVAMDNYRNWNNGYPSLTDGVEFNGATETKSLFTQSSNVKLTYVSGDGTTYCINAVSKAFPTLSYFLDTANGNKTVKKGTCEGGEGAIPYIPDPTQTIFVFDTNASGCVATRTIRLPIQYPPGNPAGVINWGDGTTGTVTGSNPSHTYASPGVYTVTYNGNIQVASLMSVSPSASRCLTQVKQWGSNAKPTNVDFYMASNLTYVAEPPATVNNMSYMFAGANSFQQNISSWDVSRIQRMTGMFYNNTTYNQPLNAWNVSSVIDMDNMFYNATAYNQPLNSWNTANVIGMQSMFYGASAFNQPIGSWNTSKVVNVSNMFNGAASFNQNISGWNTTAVTTKTDFHTGSPLIQANCPVSLW